MPKTIPIMRQVKLFRSESMEEIEKQANDFLAKIVQDEGRLIYTKPFATHVPGAGPKPAIFTTLLMVYELQTKVE